MNDFTLKNDSLLRPKFLWQANFAQEERRIFGVERGREDFTSELIKSLLSSIKYSLVYIQYLVFFVFSL